MGKGKHGASGVFASWAKALNTSEGAIKKFRDYDQAMDFVKACSVPEPEDTIVHHDEGPSVESGE